MMASLNAIPRRLAAGALLAAGTVLAPSLMAQAPAPPVTAEAAAVKKLIEQKLPGTNVRGVTKTPYFGLFEVQLDEQLVYTDAKANYMVLGSI